MSCPTRAKLIDFFPDAADDGGSIFGVMDWVPWYHVADAQALSLDYFYNHSGLKLPSGLVRQMSDEDGVIDSEAQALLSNILKARFKPKWIALWEQQTGLSESPVSDYAESMSRSRDITEGADTSVVISDTLEKEGTESDALSGSDTTTDGVGEVPRKVTKRISGGWKDSDTTSVTKSGTETITETGGHRTSIYGFDTQSMDGVRQSVVAPLEDTGTEVSFDGRSDTNSGDITRLYNSYKEETSIAGTRTDSTLYGKTTTRSFEDRKDQRDRTEDTEHAVGTSDFTEELVSGRKKSLADMFADTIQAFDSHDYFDIVYSDMDDVLTLRVWA